MGKQSKRAGREPAPATAARPAALRGHGASGDAVGLLFAVVGTLFGLSVGYMIGTQRQVAPGEVAVAAPETPPPTQTDAPLVDEQELEALRDIVARDPDNLDAVLALGNRLYDARRYAEAVPYYETAVRLDPDNVDASTDLGTALYYSGRPDDALAQYERSLAIDDAHAQTLFNIGIVSFEGLGDAQQAIDSWERLLSTNPAYPDRARVEQLLAQARQQGGG
jgi:cytochrome c-type biogenesis protein CcmH/NrfG